MSSSRTHPTLIPAIPKVWCVSETLAEKDFERWKKSELTLNPRLTGEFWAERGTLLSRVSTSRSGRRSPLICDTGLRPRGRPPGDSSFWHCPALNPSALSTFMLLLRCTGLPSDLLVLFRAPWIDCTLIMATPPVGRLFGLTSDCRSRSTWSDIWTPRPDCINVWPWWVGVTMTGSGVSSSRAAADRRFSCCDCCCDETNRLRLPCPPLLLSAFADCGSPATSMLPLHSGRGDDFWLTGVADKFARGEIVVATSSSVDIGRLETAEADPPLVSVKERHTFAHGRPNKQTKATAPHAIGRHERSKP